MKIDGNLEAKLVVQALRINTLSKLTFSDSARFDGLVQDVFPGIEFKDIEYETLGAAFREVCAENNLLVNENQVSLATKFNKNFKNKARGGGGGGGAPSSSVDRASDSRGRGPVFKIHTVHLVVGLDLT